MSNHNFYRTFEDKHRGSRELIASRLKVYLPFIKPLQEVYSTSSTIDLGCGRGEWLELTMGLGFDALGIDMDNGMLEACRALNLPVKHGDAIEYLKGLPDESLSIVSAFHVVEHIPFEMLQTLVQEAIRVLKPAGLLILETPNPENIRVGTVNFYLDPTHQKPIPPLLLSFVPDYYGFYRTKIVRLQEDGRLHNGHVSLLDVLGGVSPDYSIVAQKNGDANIIARFDDVFNTEFGLTTENLGLRYEEQLNLRVVEAEKRANEAEKRANEVEKQANEAEKRANEVEKQANEAEKRANEVEKQANEAEKRANEVELKFKELNQNSHHWYTIAQDFEQQIHSIYASRSWRITRPLRFSYQLIHSPQATIKQLTQKIGSLALKHPTTKKIGLKAFRLLPIKAQKKLRHVILQNIPTQPSQASATNHSDAVSISTQLLVTRFTHIMKQGKKL